MSEVSLFKHIRLEGDFTLSSGKKSNYFYDFDRLSPHELLNATEKLIEKIEQTGIEFDYVVAPAIGGIIPGWMVAGSFAKPLVIVDKENKLRPNWPRPTTAMSKYIIIDDVISTYQTVNKIKEIFKDAPFAGTACFVFRGESLDKNTIYLERGEVEV